MPTDEGSSLGDQLGPSAGVAVIDEDPFAECPARRGERLPDARRDQLLDSLPGELDDQVPGAVVAGGEEGAREAQAGKPIIVPVATSGWLSADALASQKKSVGCSVMRASLVVRHAGGSRWRPASEATPPPGLRRSPRQ